MFTPTCNNLHLQLLSNGHFYKPQQRNYSPIEIEYLYLVDPRGLAFQIRMQNRGSRQIKAEFL